MNQEKIGKFIAQKRKEKSLTQQDLAEQLNVTDRAISKWENGKCMPDYSLLNPLCEILDIKLADLLNGEESSDSELVLKDLIKRVQKSSSLRFVISGLIFMNISSLTNSIDIKYDFLRGFMDGALSGLMLIGAFLFVYGIVSFINKK